MAFPTIVRLSPEAIYQSYTSKPCPIGTLGMDDFGDLYRMCKAGAEISGTPEYALINANYIADGTSQDGAQCDLYSDTAAVGDRIIRIDDDNSATNRPVDHYEGGHAYFYGGSTAERQVRRIVSSTVGTSASLYIELDAPLTIAITDGAIDATPSQYSNVAPALSEASGLETFVCYQCVGGTIAAGSYFWGHTRGPQLGHYRATWPGSGQYDKDVYFYLNGSIDSTENCAVAIGTASPQRAGYLLPCNTDSYGSVFFMLQLE